MFRAAPHGTLHVKLSRFPWRTGLQGLERGGTRRLVSAVTPVPGGLGSQVKMSTRLSTLAEPTSSSWCAVHSALRTCSGLFFAPPASSSKPPPAAPLPGQLGGFIYAPAKLPELAGATSSSCCKGGSALHTSSRLFLCAA